MALEIGSLDMIQVSFTKAIVLYLTVYFIWLKHVYVITGLRLMCPSKNANKNIVVFITIQNILSFLIPISKCKFWLYSTLAKWMFFRYGIWKREQIKTWVSKNYWRFPRLKLAPALRHGKCH